MHFKLRLIELRCLSLFRADFRLDNSDFVTRKRILARVCFYNCSRTCGPIPKQGDAWKDRRFVSCDCAKPVSAGMFFDAGSIDVLLNNGESTISAVDCSSECRCPKGRVSCPKFVAGAGDRSFRGPKDGVLQPAQFVFTQFIKF